MCVCVCFDLILKIRANSLKKFELCLLYIIKSIYHGKYMSSTSPTHRLNYIVISCKKGNSLFEEDQEKNSANMVS